MRVALTQGSYQARSIIADAQRCVNLYAEANPKDALSPFTFYGCPGLTLLGDPPVAGPGRGLYWANNHALYYACGSYLHYVSPTWQITRIGLLTTNSGIVSMADNGTTMVVVDGSLTGYRVDLTTNVFEQISAANSSPPPTSTFAFYGADRVDIVDGFLLFNQSATRNFYSTYDNEVVFDSLYFAAKNGYSDNLVTLIVVRREIWLIGERTTEIWYDAGNAAFPFAIMPGPFIQHGCIAKWSVASVDGAVFWLAQDQAGATQVIRGEGYAAKIISTRAMENQFASYPTVTDAQGFCFTMNGHTFYQLNFPTANKSWRWDERTPDIWHEAVWLDTNGNENRHRASCAAWAYGMNVCADWQTGQLYAFDLNNATDNGAPMQFRRGYPHMMKDGHRVIYSGFTLDVQAGTASNVPNPVGPFPLMPDQPPPQTVDAGRVEEALFAGPAPPKLTTQPLVFLRWSDDRGETWGNPVPQTLGATGRYRAQPAWKRLGLARDRMFEVYGTIPGPLAINGAFLEPEPIVMGA